MEPATATKFDDLRIEPPKDVLKIARPGLTLLHERKHNFDHHLCDKIIGYTEFPGERPLRPTHVHYLLNCMMRGTFHPEWVQLILCEFGDDVFRMNGQHTCMARFEMPKAWKDAGQVRVMTYRADTMDALRELYSSIDRGAPRTKGNVINSYLAGTEDFADVPQRIISNVSTALAFWLWDTPTERTKHDGDEVAYLMTHAYKALTQCVIGFCMEPPSVTGLSFLRRASVIAAMFETFGKVHQDSVEFWTAVKTGVGLDSATDPRLRLRDALMNTSTHSTDVMSVSRAKTVDRETMYRWCVNAFNCWRKGEPMKSLRSTKDRQRAK